MIASTVAMSAVRELRGRQTIEEGTRPMNILVSGASGLVGTALTRSLEADGHRAIALVRHPPEVLDEAPWRPDEDFIDLSRADALDAVVHLAGENIASGRWTDEKMAAIRDSRVNGTKLVAEAIARLDPKPKVLVCASAIGFYGDRGDELLDEGATAGQGFLPEVCRDWEAATRPAADAGIRVVNLRIGVVLAKDGGALAKMLTPFKLGAGGKIGSGRQYMSWIALDDVVGAIRHAITTESLSGPVNAVAPQAATNLEFTKALGRALSRPTLFPMPVFAARLALGKMADDLLLASTRVEPKALQTSGYAFDQPELDGALRAILAR